VPLSASALEPLLRVAVVPGIGPARLQQLLRRFGSAERVLAADEREILALPGFGSELARRVATARTPGGHDRARRALGLLQRHGAVALTPDDQDYPEPFLQLVDPPFLVFASGDRALLERPCVAIVGTRRPSDYGRQAAAALSRGLVEAGYVVVSGMASGIDAAAHQAALEAGGGTIGVLGTGIERTYPAENRRLFRDMRERGLLLTEFAPGEEPKAGNFPRRNRLIAALALGVLVVEMGTRSGARHTVDAALDLGRDVFAVPGPIGSEVSAGSNELIKHGAALITGVGDVLDALQGVSRDRPSARPRGAGSGREAAPAAAPSLPLDLPAGAAELLGAMDGNARHIDDLAAAAGFPPGDVLALLLQLELLDLVESEPGKLFRRR
jgi:DNA processing protein